MIHGSSLELRIKLTTDLLGTGLAVWSTQARAERKYLAPLKIDPKLKPSMDGLQRLMKQV